MADVTSVPSRMRRVSACDRAERDPGVGGAGQAVASHREEVVGAEEGVEARRLCGLCHAQLLVVGGTHLGLHEDADFHGAHANRAGPIPGRATHGGPGAGQTAPMDIGVIFPQTEVGGDRGAVRALGQAASDLGYTHLAAYDHVLGADTTVHGDLGGPYTIDDTFREPLTMFAYLAGCTDLAFATSILIGPQRQTALLAKQSAEVDLLCGGRFRLGLGIGWNKVEYDALGVPFEKRGAILEEQIAVLRALWTERSVTVHGRFHDIESAGLAPLPVQRPIPIWIGAYAPAALRRVGRVADGWFPQARPGGGLEKSLETIREGAAEAGRDMSQFQFEGRIEYGTRDHDTMAEHARRWREAGASHLSINTMHAGLEGVDAHIAALAEMVPVLLPH